MSAMQSIKDQIVQLTTGNDMYLNLNKRWTYLLESYLGGESYKDGNHLTKYQLETNAEFRARVLNTPLDNHCSSVVSVYNSFLFRTVPLREFGNINGMPELEQFMKDADKDGRNFNNFIIPNFLW